MSLVFKHVHKRFGNHRVLKDVSMDLGHGDRLALIGANGSGKTTMLRLAAGLLRPTEGSVLRDGHPTTSIQGRLGMAYVGQDNPVYAELSVREHLRWWSRLHRAQPDVDRWLDAADLRRSAEDSAASLSRGQRQRLHLCMALSIEPELLVLDEPTSALDADAEEWFFDTVSQHTGTILAATHDHQFAQRLHAKERHMGAAWD